MVWMSAVYPDYIVVTHDRGTVRIHIPVDGFHEVLVWLKGVNRNVAVKGL